MRLILKPDQVPDVVDALLSQCGLEERLISRLIVLIRGKDANVPIGCRPGGTHCQKGIGARYRIAWGQVSGQVALVTNRSLPNLVDPGIFARGRGCGLSKTLTK